MKLAPLMLLALISPTLTCASDPQNVRQKSHQDAGSGLDTTVISEAQPMADDQTKLWYAVCNLAPKGLIFRWVQPGFENGWNHPLGQNRCAVYETESKKVSLEDNTDLLYTQRGVQYGAAAFLPDKTPIGLSFWEWKTYLFESAPSKEYKQPDKEYDLQVISTNKGDVTRNAVSWSSNVDSVLVRLISTDKKSHGYIDEQLPSQKNLSPDSGRVSAATLNAQTMSGDQAPGRFPEGEYVRLRAKEGSERTAEFSMFVGERKEYITTPVYALDRNGQPIWIMQLQQ